MEKEFIQSLVTVFERDLKKLETEISSYPDEASLWMLSGAINNTAGNLCLHLCGNLQHFIGAVLGKSGYIRNREHEFAARNIPRSQLLAEIAATITVIKSTLAEIPQQELAKEYPAQVFDFTMTTTFFLVHLAAHLSYHLGQVNYHRRILSTPA